MTSEVLTRFGKTINMSRRGYRAIVADGIAMGRRNDLIGSGQHRRQTASNRRGEDLRDARVLGSGDFVEQLLMQAEAKPTLLKLMASQKVRSTALQQFFLTLTYHM